MGHSTDPDPYGENCYTCWPVGESPSVVYIAFEGVVACPPNAPPANASIACPQVLGYPCYYEEAHGPWEFGYAGALLEGSWVKQRWGGAVYFSGFEPLDCQQNFINEMVCGMGGAFGEGGGASVMWNSGPTDHSIGSLLDSINMKPEPSTKWEHWSAADKKTVVRFARKSDSTNILILVDTEEL